MNFHADPPKEFLAGLGLYFPLISTRDVSFQPYVLQILELFSGLGAVFVSLTAITPMQEQFPKAVTCAMPAQTIAARAGSGDCICLRPTFIALNDVINFPVPVWGFTPSPILELDWVPTEMAVATRLVVDVP